MRTPLWLCLALLAGLTAVEGQVVYPNPNLRTVVANVNEQCVVEQHAVYFNDSIRTVHVTDTDQLNGCCIACGEYTRSVKSQQAGRATTEVERCNLWTWCDRQAMQNCTLHSDVADPPAWTNMRPGQCVLQYLREAQRGFSNSPRLNGNRNRTGPDLNYWTGATLPDNVNSVPNPPAYAKFAGIELTLKYDWIDCPDDVPFGPVALGQTPMEYCWRKGSPKDLVTYCTRHPQCDAMTLFYNGFSLNYNYSHCWPSAFFKTGGGQNLSLATTLTLSPQAVLYVKASAWQPSHDTINANADAGIDTTYNGNIQAKQLDVLPNYDVKTDWRCVFNYDGGTATSTFGGNGRLQESLQQPPPPDECPQPIACPDLSCGPAARLFQVTNDTFLGFGLPFRLGRNTTTGEGIFQTAGDCCSKCRDMPGCKHWVFCGVRGGCGAGCNETLRGIGISGAAVNSTVRCWGQHSWPTGMCMLLGDPLGGGPPNVLQAGQNTLWVSGTPFTDDSRGISTSVVVGAVVGAIVLMVAGIAGVLLYRRHRRMRPKYMFDEPSMLEDKKGHSGTNDTSGTNGTTSSSTISDELRRAAFHINPKDIVIEQGEHGPVLLGKGAFGEVYAATWFQTKVAVKYLTKEGGEAEKEFLNEIKVMSECFHQNIVTFYSACMEPHRFMLVYEFMAAGDLTKALARDQNEPRRLGWHGVGLKILLDVARGLAFLHNRRVIHYDIKSSNVLLDTLSKHVTAKIADVGLSRVMQATLATLTDGHFMRGTEAYMAPELFQYGGPRPTTAVDMYSFGVLVWEVITGERPWMVRGGILRDIEVPDEAPAEASALVKELTAHDPAHRPCASAVVERLEELQPGFTRHASQPLSAGSSLPGSLPSVDSRGRPLTWGAGEHRRNASH